MNIKEKNKKACRFLVEHFFTAKENNTFGYSILAKNDSFSVYKRNIGEKRIEAAYKNIAVISNNKRKTLFIYPDIRYPLLHSSVRFNRNNFPGLLDDSKIEYCLVLPFVRKTSERSLKKSWRVVVVTDKAQIFHNFPARNQNCDGVSLESDITKFEESVVWDLPNHKYPSKKETNDSTERVYLGLPDEAYEFHPEIDKKSKYGNNGFPKKLKIGNKELSRFYIPQRTRESNPFFYMSGFSTDYKMTVLGTYRSNNNIGVRTCIFASHDGGRQWFCKYEFGDMGEYNFQQGFSEWGHNFGNKICPNEIKKNNLISFSRRKNIIPNNTVKEPETKFVWEEELTGQIIESNDTITLRTDDKHRLVTGNIVAITKADEDTQWMVNNTCDKQTAGNGLLFKVEVINDDTIKLYEYVSSPDNPISCRHIHHINRVRDGWIIGTGETYPNSWILYMQMKEADTFSIKEASSEFDICRLNSSEKSVQRTLGVIWNENDNSIMYASDHDILEEKELIYPIEGRDLSISRNATGIYKCKLSNIDDYNKSEIIFEALEPAFFFRKIDEVLVFSGQRGELSLSFDNGNTWKSMNIEEALNHPRGKSYSWLVFDDYLLKLN